MDKLDGFSLIIPAYNEEKGIGPVLEEILGSVKGLTLPSEIIVVDDGSTDNTTGVVTKFKEVSLVSHSQNKGYGAAIKTGIRHARYAWIGITDADGTYPNEAIPELLSYMDSHEMVVGARVGKGVRIPLVRRPAKMILAILANYLTQTRIPDLNSGLRIFSFEAVRKHLPILPDAFSFTTTITLAMLSSDERVKFQPISYSARIGRSKIRPIHDTLNFVQLIIRTILFFNPLRVFLPMGAMLLLVSFLLFILRLSGIGPFGVTIPMFLLAGIQVTAIGMLADLIDRRTRP